MEKKHKPNSQVARELKEGLIKWPGMTVTELAAYLEVEEEQIVHVLDSYHPDEGQVGVGQGHGWVDPQVAVDQGIISGINLVLTSDENPEP